VPTKQRRRPLRPSVIHRAAPSRRPNGEEHLSPKQLQNQEQSPWDSRR
jgi:hypothetical protein